MKNLLIGIGLTIAGGLYLWDKTRDPLPSVLAPPAKEIKNAQKQTVACTKLETYSEPVKKEMGLPVDVVRDGQAKVVAATQVPGDDYPRTVTAVANLDTGDVTQYVRRDRLPWLGTATRYNVGLYYGARTDADALVARLVASGEFMQLKRLNLGGTVSVDADGQAFGGVGISIRF